MYTTENYLWGWVVYAVGALFLMFVLWVTLRRFPWAAFRHVLLIITSAFLFTPITAYQDDKHLAPAFFVSLYEGVFLGGDTSFQRGLAPILAVVVGLLVLYTLLRIMIFWWRKKHRHSQSASNSLPEEEPEESFDIQGRPITASRADR